MQIGSVVILARLLTPADFGIVTMVTTFSLLFRSFGLNGFTELIMQREELTILSRAISFGLNLGIGAILTLVFAGSGRLLALFYHNSAVAQVTAGMSLTIGIGCLGWIHMGLLQRAMHFRTTAIINFVGQLVLVIVSIVLAMAGWHYWALVWGSVTQTVIVAAGAWLMCRWIPSRPGRASGTRSGLKFAMNVYSHYAFSYLTRNTDNLLVGWRYGAQSLGFYKKAYDLFVLPETQLLAPLSAVVVSTLSRVNWEPRTIPALFSAGDSGFGARGDGNRSGFCIGRKGYNSFSSGAWLGRGWSNLRIVRSGNRVMLLYNTHGWVHLSIGRPERWFRWGLMEFVCTASLFLLALHWGPSGIALAWTVSYFLLMFPGFWYAGKPIGLGIGPVFAVIWKFFAASAGAGVVQPVLIIRAIPHFAMTLGDCGRFREDGLPVSPVFFALYLGAVIALHGA